MRKQTKSRETRRAKLMRIPEGTLRKIEAAAKRERRSVQGQILYYVELALSDGKAA
jgi:hypothetical protein